MLLSAGFSFVRQNDATTPPRTMTAGHAIKDIFSAGVFKQLPIFARHVPRLRFLRESFTFMSDFGLA